MIIKIINTAFVEEIDGCSRSSSAFAHGRWGFRCLEPSARFAGQFWTRTDAAIVGARVRVRSEATATSLLTDSNGRFAVELPPGVYTLDFVADGFAAVSRAISINSGKSESLDIVLRPEVSTATVTVVATDALGYRTEAVNSATRTFTALRDVPQSITVVSSKQIKDQSMASIADVV